MSSTNQTNMLNLSQFSANDTPKWLSDYNSDMNKIDDFAAEKGEKGGLASLDANGKLVQMPTAIDVGAAPLSFVPTGVIFIWSAEDAPEGFMLCDGTEVLREEYPDLFSTIGTTYGEGNGSTTFNLPNLIYRVPVGSDNNTYKVGAKGGEPTQDLVACSGAVVENVKNIGYLSTEAPVASYNMAVEGANGSSGEWTANHGTKVLKDDGTAPTTLQPYLVLNYIIKY